MKNLIGALVKAYAAVAAYTLFLLGVVAAVLLASGALTPERMKEALQVLRTPREKSVERTAVLSDEERKELEKTQRQKQETLDLREKDLQKLGARVDSELARMQGERGALEKSEQKLKGEQEQLKKDREALAAARSDAEVTANLPILSKMDGVGIVSVMKGWDDARFVRYLRAMKPGKAAEVLDTVRTDPQFEPEFRRLPEDAALGAKTRADRLIEEFKKVP
jgi:phosphoenolpyruvate synthase/pyruvate phosphate dikinase